MRYIAWMLSMGMFFACSAKKADSIPACIAAKIDSLKTADKGNPAYSVYRYTYNGKNVYYFPSQCCDRFSDLLDENCQVICHPDGGFTGKGDGNCADFFTTRKDELLVWKDNR
jgi:hypothetical protein